MLRWYEVDIDRSKTGLTANYEAIDPRDYIYALLGLASGLDLEMIGDPDHTCSVDVVYTELVGALVRERGSLDILCFAPLFESHDYSHNEERRLPSSVPDWRNRRETFAVPLLVCQSSRTDIGNVEFVPKQLSIDHTISYAAAGGMRPQVSYCGDSRNMFCKRIFLDYIDGLGPLGEAMYSRHGDSVVRKLVQVTTTGLAVLARQG